MSNVICICLFSASILTHVHPLLDEVWNSYQVGPISYPIVNIHLLIWKPKKCTYKKYFFKYYILDLYHRLVSFLSCLDLPYLSTHILSINVNYMFNTCPKKKNYMFNEDTCGRCTKKRKILVAAVNSIKILFIYCYDSYNIH